MCFKKILDIFVWPEKITQVCNLCRARISKEIWNVFEKKINLFDFCIAEKIWQFLFYMIVEYYSGPVCAVMIQWKRSYWIGTLNFEKGWSGKLNFWQLSAKWEFLRVVDQGNLTSGNFWQNMGRCKIVKNLIVTQNEEEQVSLRDWIKPFSACWEKWEYHFSLCREHKFVRWCLWVTSTRKNICVKFSYERDGHSAPEFPNLVMRGIGVSLWNFWIQF